MIGTLAPTSVFWKSKITNCVWRGKTPLKTGANAMVIVQLPPAGSACVSQPDRGNSGAESVSMLMSRFRVAVPTLVTTTCCVAVEVPTWMSPGKLRDVGATEMIGLATPCAVIANTSDAVAPSGFHGPVNVRAAVSAPTWTPGVYTTSTAHVPPDAIGPPHVERVIANRLPAGNETLVIDVSCGQKFSIDSVPVLLVKPSRTGPRSSGGTGVETSGNHPTVSGSWISPC